MRGLIYLARQRPGEVVLVADIAAAMEVPDSFLAKIFQNLARAGLVRSTRGHGGGYALARPPAKITLLEVVECVEGPIVLNDCTDPITVEGETMACTSACSAQEVWQEVQEAVRGILEKKTMDELAAVPAPPTTAAQPIAFGAPR